MELKHYHCLSCGADDVEIKGNTCKCRFCDAVYHIDSAQEYIDEVCKIFGDAFAEQKEEAIANCRKNLWKAVHARHISGTDVLNYVRELKNLLPDDFQANFYEVAVSGSQKQLNAFLNSIDVSKYGMYIEDVVEFVIPGLESSNVLPLKDLVTRGLKGDLYTKYITEIEDEAAKIKAGLYSPQVPRDVFLAYSSKDRKAVNEIVEFLEDNKISCFVALRNMRHGRNAVENYMNQLKTAMHNCKCVLFLSSENSRDLDCDALKIELPYIKDNEPNMGRIEYILSDYSRETSEAAKRILESFFAELEHCRTKEDLLDRVLKYITGSESRPDEGRQVKFCEECGAQNPSDVQFCGNCGNKSFVSSYEEYVRINIRKEYEEKLKKQAEELEAQLKKQNEEVVATANAEATRKIKEAEERAAKALKEKEEAQKKAEKTQAKQAKVAEKAAQKTEKAKLHTQKTQAKAASAKSQNSIKDIIFKNKKLMLAVFIIMLVVGVFDFIFAYCTPIYADTIYFTIWVVFLCIFGALLLFDLILFFTNRNAGSYILLICLGAFAVVTLIGTLIGWFNKSMWLWTWLYVGIIGAITIIAMIVSCEDMESDWFSAWLHIPVFFVIGALVFGGLYIAQYQGDGKYENFYYVKNSDNTLIIWARDYSSEELIYPDSIDGYVVTTIKPTKNNKNNNLKRIVMPDSIITIDNKAFKNCNELTTIEFSNSLITIGENAFENCNSLVDVVLPESLETIDNEAFRNCSSLYSVHVGDAVVRINSRAFENCLYLNDIFIPISVGYVGYDTFNGCVRLTIYAEAESAPTGFWSKWGGNWNGGRPVNWSVTRGEYLAKR